MPDSVALPGPLQILADYEELRPMMSFGMYVLPDTVDLYIWHGLIMLREGRYKNGVFRFIILIHPLYPADGARPMVVFLEKPFHPLIHPKSGAFQLEVRFPLWRSGVDRLPPVVEYIREVLTSDLVMTPSAKSSIEPFNPDAAKICRSSPEEFDARALASATRSYSSAVAEVSVVSGVVPPASVTGPEREDPYAWLRSPLVATSALLTSTGALSSTGKEVATIARHIGERRGFRLAEPSPYHESLLQHIRSAKLKESDFTDVIVRGMGAAPPDEPSSPVLSSEPAPSPALAHSPAGTALHIGPESIPTNKVLGTP